MILNPDHIGRDRNGAEGEPGVGADAASRLSRYPAGIPDAGAGIPEASAGRIDRSGAANGEQEFRLTDSLPANSLPAKSKPEPSPELQTQRREPLAKKYPALCIVYAEVHEYEVQNGKTIPRRCSKVWADAARAILQLKSEEAVEVPARVRNIQRRAAEQKLIEISLKASKVLALAEIHGRLIQLGTDPSQSAWGNSVAKFAYTLGVVKVTPYADDVVAADLLLQIILPQLMVDSVCFEQFICKLEKQIKGVEETSSARKNWIARSTDITRLGSLIGTQRSSSAASSPAPEDIQFGASFDRDSLPPFPAVAIYHLGIIGARLIAANPKHLDKVEKLFSVLRIDKLGLTEAFLHAGNN